MDGDAAVDVRSVPASLVEGLEKVDRRLVCDCDFVGQVRRDVGVAEGSREDNYGLCVGPVARGQVEDDFVGFSTKYDAVDRVNELGVTVLFGGRALVFEPVDLMVFAGDVAVEAGGYEDVASGHSSSPQRTPVLVSTRSGTSRSIAAGIMSWARDVISSSSPGAISKMSSSWT